MNNYLVKILIQILVQVSKPKFNVVIMTSIQPWKLWISISNKMMVRNTVAASVSNFQC